MAQKKNGMKNWHGQAWPGLAMAMAMATAMAAAAAAAMAMAMAMPIVYLRYLFLSQNNYLFFLFAGGFLIHWDGTNFDYIFV